MDKESSTINNYNHSVSLLERKTLVITGVKKIDNFDKLHFILETTMGFMVIKGEGLELIKLDTLAGNVTIKGTIDSINYVVENKKKEEEILQISSSIKENEIRKESLHEEIQQLQKSLTSIQTIQDNEIDITNHHELQKIEKEIAKVQEEHEARIQKVQFP